jgi:hypothetical protein
METPWKRRSPDQLWLRVLSQIVVAGNSGPQYTLSHSDAVREKLAFSRLKKMSPTSRRRVIHSVLRAIGTRYVGQSSNNRKVGAALHNFKALADAGGPKKFFERVEALPTERERIHFLNDGKTLQYFGKKGARDTLIDLGLAKKCLA